MMYNQNRMYADDFCEYSQGISAFFMRFKLIVKRGEELC